MQDSANTPLISVILPVYNGEKRLEPCLEALLAQTADSMEILAIDDGSTDSSPAILDRYAESDSRLRVVHQPNSGVWSARLTAISLAGGAWLGFCDADDIPAPDLYSSLLASAQENQAQMAVCAYRRVDARTGDLLGIEMPGGTGTLNPREDPVRFAGVNTALWNKLFDADVVRSSPAVRDAGHRDKPRLMEDMVLIASFLSRIDTVSFVAEPLYDYIVQPGSSMRTLSIEDVQTVARWLVLLRAGMDEDLQACVDVMAFFHLGISALDNLMRTATHGQLRDYQRWVKKTLKRDFPLYTTPAKTSDMFILRLRVARLLFRMGLLLPGMRVMGMVNRMTRREVT